MKIKAPLRRARDVAALVRAGADELYCGVVTGDWRRRGWTPNARADSLYPANLEGFDELSRALHEARRASVPLHFCANALCQEDCREALLDDLRRAAAMGVDGFIVADPSLVPFLRGLGGRPRIVLGCMASCFNARTLRFFSRLGADAVVPDRQLTLEELPPLARAARDEGLDLEVFIKNIACVNVNAFCRRLHGPYSRPLGQGKTLWMLAAARLLGAFPALLRRVSPALAACRERKTWSVYERGEGGWSLHERWDSRADEESHLFYCAVCALPVLEACGVGRVKIIGRHLPAWAVARDIRLIKEYLAAMSRSARAPAVDTALGRRLHRRIVGGDCLPGQCWHQECLRQRGQAS